MGFSGGIYKGHRVGQFYAEHDGSVWRCTSSDKRGNSESGELMANFARPKHAEEWAQMMNKRRSRK